jgi:HJR/Mrr/RecB family endonuclease
MPRRSENGLFELVFATTGLVVLAFRFLPQARIAIASLIVLGLLTAAGFVCLRLLQRGGRVMVREEHATRTRAQPSSVFNIAEFNQELLDELEWRRFEQLVLWYFEKAGFNAKRSRVGADGGVDILVSRPTEAKPFAFVQCKSWTARKVGVKEARELYGVMAAAKIEKGYLITSGDFTKEAHEFAANKELKLVGGSYLLEKIKTLSVEDQSDLLRKSTFGDYTTPTCPQCDVRMVRRQSIHGEFWGCVNYSRRPSCRQKLHPRGSQSVSTISSGRPGSSS